MIVDFTKYMDALFDVETARQGQRAAWAVLGQLNKKLVQHRLQFGLIRPAPSARPSVV